MLSKECAECVYAKQCLGETMHACVVNDLVYSKPSIDEIGSELKEISSRLGIGDRIKRMKKRKHLYPLEKSTPLHTM
jgi:hypothetical protein